MRTNKAHWDSQAKKGDKACTQDLIAKELEVKAILDYASNDMKVLDMGCGNGITLIKMAQKYDIEGVGIDQSLPLIEDARRRAKKARVKLVFEVGGIGDVEGEYDLIYTERFLINLESWEAQRHAIECLLSHLAPAGTLLLCENSKQGLRRINTLRGLLGLPEIKPPWHNLYLDDNKLEDYHELVDRIDYSSTYYFLSRVVNAGLNKKPKYDSPINKLALKLPPLVDGIGQGKLWVFRLGGEICGDVFK